MIGQAPRRLPCLLLKSPAPVAAAVPASADVDPRPFTIRKIIAKRLHESLSTMAQYTLNGSRRVGTPGALRAKIKDNGEKLGLANINIETW